MWSAIVLLVLLPALAMRFTREVNWTVLDFFAAAILLGGAGLVYEIAASRIDHPIRRIMATLAIVVALLLVWVQGAVGIV